MNFNTLMDKLLNEVSANDFNSITLKDLNEQSPDLWKQLLNYLQNEATYLSHSYIRDGDDITGGTDSTSSVIGRIDELADLNENTFDNFINNIKQYLDDSTDTGVRSDYKGYFWNESVSKLISYILLHFDSNITIEKEQQEGNYSESDDGATVKYGGIPTSGYDFRVFDVKNADAGRAFNSNPHARWARPWYNIDGNSYGKVRGSDKILSVLGNKDNLQFTHTKGENEWIRLIMPKYTRAVEIEDLNRNFWVIGQVITAISAYLFEEKSPIFEVLERITKEIMQLWENIMYLWLAFALISQKPYYTKLHKEIVVVNSRDFFGDVRYDDFTNSIANDITVEAAWNKISYLKDTYPECNLCIIPKVRLNNYEHNYYSKERYPGAVLYNRNTDTTTFVPFYDKEHPEYADISCENYLQYLTAIMDTKENYKWIRPATEADGYPDNDTYRYHSFIRTEGQITADFDVAENKITFTTFNLKLYDGGKDIIPDTQANIPNTQASRDPFLTVTWTRRSPISPEIIRIDSPPTSPYRSAHGTASYGKGYYLGDVMSYGAVSLSLGAVDVEEIYMAPIGGPHWDADWVKDDDMYKRKNPYNHGGRWDLVTENGKASEYNEMVKNLAETNIEIINKYIDGKALTSNGIKLFVGTRKSDLYLDNDIQELFRTDYHRQIKQGDGYVDLTEANCKEIPENIKKEYSEHLSGYYYLDGNNNIKYLKRYNSNERDIYDDGTDGVYNGRYLEMHKYDGNFQSDMVQRYLLPDEKLSYDEDTSIDNIKSIANGYLIDINGNTILDPSRRVLRMQECTDDGKTSASATKYAESHTPSELTRYPNPKYEKVSGTNGINLTYRISRYLHQISGTNPDSTPHYMDPSYSHMMLRYNNYRQTNYRGAVLVIPDGASKKKYTYKQFHHLYSFIPLKKEFSQSYKLNCTDNDDLCAKSVTFDTNDRETWGRKRFSQDYLYTFVKRGEQMGKDNWFILYVQVCGTFRAFNSYYALQTIDSGESATYDFVILYNQSGFNNLNSLIDQTGFDQSELEEDAVFEESRDIPNINSTNRSKVAKQSAKAQYMLEASSSDQESLDTYTEEEVEGKTRKIYKYADHMHVYRNGFSNVSLCSYKERKNSEGKYIPWCDMKTARALAAYIALTVINNGVSPTEISYNQYMGNSTLEFNEKYNYYRSPSNAAKWLAKNITSPHSGTNPERPYYIKRGASSLEGAILRCLVHNSSDSSADPVYLGSLMWQAENLTSAEKADIDTIYDKVHFDERMKPTVTQVRCHIFTPDGGYARYEKDCINDYGEIRGRWKEQCPVGKSIWGKYSAAIEDATESFNSTFVRYDDNYYYYDFYHDPHQGKPDLPIPNKTTQG